MTVPHGPVDVLLAELHASRGGLTADEARRRLGAVGPNEPAHAPRTAGLVQILLLLANPLVIILLIASVASGILGERVRQGNSHVANSWIFELENQSAACRFWA